MKIVCHLANLNIIGSKFSTNADGELVRNIIPLSVNGFNLELIQDKSIINCSPSELIGKFVHSTLIIAQDVSENSLNKLIKTIDKITVLLSLATDSQVRFYKCTDASGMTLREWSVKGVYYCSRPLLCTVDTRCIVQLIEKSYATFDRIERSYKLKSAVELFVASESLTLQFELKLASIFILLENLKSSYAENNGYTFHKGYYRKNGVKGTFKLLLSEMLLSVGITPKLSKVVKLRNEIIHSGLSRLHFEEQTDIFSLCKELAGEYLLRLLNYDGVFYLHTTNGSKIKNLGSY